MLRPGHFRHRLLDEAFLSQHSAQAYKSLQPFLLLWKKNEISAAEMAALYILIFSFLRRPQDFLGGPHQENLKVNSKESILTCHKVLEILLATLNDSENVDALEPAYS